MTTEIDLASVIARAQQGEPEAVATLYTFYAERIRRYCYARLSDAEAAQDCVQEVFLRVWKAIRSFQYRDELAFTAWLFTIASNVVISNVRKQRKVVQQSVEDLTHLPTSHDLATTVGEQLALQHAIGQLTAEQQHIISLRFFAGLSMLEIANMTNRTEGAVKALQHRALRRLQRLLSDDRTIPRATTNVLQPTFPMALA